MKITPWISAPPKLNLDIKTIHIWRIDLAVDDNAVSENLKFLDDIEGSRASRFKFPQHRRRFIVAHGQLRKILGRYTQQTAEKVVLAKHSHGKPYLPYYSALEFNLSHSEDLAICAVTFSTPLGVDVEYHNATPNFLDIAERFFAADEHKALCALPQPLQRQGFYNAWTRKEAFIKALGEGLRYPLDKFSVELDPTLPARIKRIATAEEEVNAWELHDFIPAPQYTAALAICRRSNTCHFYY